ncbi:MAG: YaeQ family protein [Rhodospirillales bacterium]|nr:YaeQ family protein [Rhodospirillales bacterium]
MAQKATIYKAELSIADMDRHYYEDHNLTIAKHPSETDERMMVRILAFALNAHEHLQFTKGISTDDEPDLWQKSLSDEIELWIELGLPSEKSIRQANGRADKTIVYCYGGNTADAWWEKMEDKTTRFKNLQISNLAQKETKDLAKLASRNMQLQISIQDGDAMVSSEDTTLHITPLKWKDASI